jgi:hypothetical protein
MVQRSRLWTSAVVAGFLAAAACGAAIALLALGFIM